MLSDDLPWPELGNVSRGATRGNQGQKGVLGSPDGEGRAILQLRVQPGVLAVRLNRQATEWYRILDGEVNHALKLTKTYWRKARRRQDYDARADQDHMELHEWLQQLKDKVMTHLELLMQKGEIQGPPYIMPENVELTFLKKFIERQAANIPHNPRLRQAYLEGRSPRMTSHHPSIISSEGTSTPLSATWEVMDDEKDDTDEEPALSPAPTSSNDVQTLMSEVQSSQRTLKSARASLARAQKDANDAFLRYKSCLDVEAKAMQQLGAVEECRDVLLSALVDGYKALGIEAPQTASPHLTSDNTMDASMNRPASSSSAGLEQPNSSNAMAIQDAVPWDETPDARWPRSHSIGISDSRSTTQDNTFGLSTTIQEVQLSTSESLVGRKHPRGWESHRSIAEDSSSLPPRKRHQMTGDESLVSSPRHISTTHQVTYPSPNTQTLSRPDHRVHSLSNGLSHSQLTNMTM